MRYEQVCTLVNGMGMDVDPAKLDQQGLKFAQNIHITQSGREYQVSSIGGGTEISLPEQVDEIVGVFDVKARYGSDGDDFDSLLIFSYVDSVIGLKEREFKIWILNSEDNSIYKVYDDANRPARERSEPLDIQPSMSLVLTSDGPDYYAIWLDGKNPIRHLRLHVNNTSQYDNTGPNSVLTVPDEPDLLYLQRLNPVNRLEVAGIKKNGSMKTGSYQFAYRYFNSVSRRYSAITPLTQPIPILPVETDLKSSGSTYGGGLGKPTNKSIELLLDKFHFHNRYYDSVQLFVAYNNGLTTEVSKLRPSKNFYGAPSSVSFFEFTGTEQVEDATILDITVNDAEILTANTISEENGNIFIGRPVYYDLEVGDQPNIGAETSLTTLPMFHDPLDNAIPANIQGYYSELNCHKYVGYMRDELYRFGITYGNKFGFRSRPKPIDFSSLAKASSSNRLLNWTSDGPDWKFPKRDNPETHLFVTNNTSGIKVMSLNLSGIDNHPEWAYDLDIVRAERDKNILGQTPVINGMAVMGGTHITGADLGQKLDYSQHPWLSGFGWTYQGGEDYIGPKILSHGATKHLLLNYLQAQDGSSNQLPFRWYYPTWVLNYTEQKVHTYFLYPPEYLYNESGESQSEIRMDGSERLEIIDVCMLEGYNAYRDPDFHDGSTNSSSGNPTLNQITFGTQSRNVWIFAPSSWGSYYFMNGHSPNYLLNQQFSPEDGQYAIPVAPEGGIKIARGWQMGYGQAPILTNVSLGVGDLVEHIKKIGNLSELSKAQTTDTLDILYDSEFKPPNTTLNQRCLVVTTDIDNRQPDGQDIIYDPTPFIKAFYQDDVGGINGGLGNIFSLVFANTNEIDTQALREEHDTLNTDPTAANVASVKLLSEENPTIPPGSTVAVYIANITKGKGDLRYGDIDKGRDFIFTGAWATISEDEIVRQTDKSFNVFGGDTYITHHAFKVHDNVPSKTSADLSDNAFDVVLKPGEDPNPDFITAVSTRETYIEIVHITLESTINTNFVARELSDYPNGFFSRIQEGTEDYTANTAHQYPENMGLTPYNGPWLYNYNFGYSRENDHAKLLSKDSLEENFDRIRGRIHYSNQRLLNGGLNGYDRFLTADQIDVDGQFGDIVAIIRTGDKRHLIIQEDAVAVMFLGRTPVEDADGLTINISSGSIIGYIQYTSSMKSIGIQDVNHVQNIGGSVYILDQKRNKVVMLGPSGAAQDMSDYTVESWLKDELLPSYDTNNPGTINLDVDHVNKRIWITSSADDSGKAISFSANRSQWESTYKLNNLFRRMLSSGKRTYGFIKDKISNSIRIFNLYEGGDPNNFMGEEYTGHIEVSLNNGKHAHKQKTLIHTRVVSSKKPDYAEAEIEEDGTVSDRRFVTNVPFVKKFNSYYANRFIDEIVKGRRFKDANILIRVFIKGVIKISSLVIAYRITENDD